jgi:8-oxo-dGTP diphosphatase
MIVRGVEIEPACVAARDAGAETYLDAVEPVVHGGIDEASLRAAYAGGIRDARERSAASVALPALGIAGGVSPVIAGKIIVQEAIRAARTGGAGVRKIILCCSDRDAFNAFQKTVNGYLSHLLEVLVWGPFVTVDAIIQVPAGIVLVKRRNPPLGFALPGGFVDYGETLEKAVIREAKEETGLDLLDLKQFHTYSDPARDPRFQTITTVFSARADGTPEAGDDAAEVHVVKPAQIDGLSFAFDHKQVLKDWLANG